LRWSCVEIASAVVSADRAGEERRNSGKAVQEVDMGRYVILIVVPIIIGVLIAAGVVLFNGLRQRRIDARLALLEARRPVVALSAADSPPKEESSDLTHRRIAS
jgi:hypothetical protein